MKFTVYTANCTGNERNVLYPNRVEITDGNALQSAAVYDHVCAKYEGCCRGREKFLASDVVVMDCDNSHTDDPAQWVTGERLMAMLPDIAMAVVPSRNHMKEKHGKSARPRFHAYFMIPEMTDAGTYTALKQSIQRRFPFFDGAALDAARFLYGSHAKASLWQDGKKTIADLFCREEQGKSIPQGQRNNTMSQFAGRLVKRYGVTERAHIIFLERAAECEPRLSDDELGTIWRSAAKFARKVQAQPGYVPPEEYEFQRMSLKPDDYSDIGQAKVLAREYGSELKYTPATDYLRYDGTTWNESRAQAVGAVEEFLDLQLADAQDAVKKAADALTGAGVAKDKVSKGGKTLEKEITDARRQAYAAYLSAHAYLTFVEKRRDMRYVLSALQAARPMLEIRVADLDHDAFLLNTPDGTYDLRLGMAGKREHRPEDYATKVTSVSPGDQGKQIWQDAIGTFFCGDIELMDYVQQVVGLAAVGKVFVEALIIAYGEGRNGKSTFWNTISRVLGTYSGNISADTLTVGCKRNYKPELAEAKGKRMLIAAELDEGMRLNTAIIKQLCSTDEIQAEKKYKDPFHFTPSHTLILYTNHLPRVGANDPGTWRRLLIIPFDAVIEGNSDIKNYAEYLAEKAGPAVLSWVIEGAQKVIQNGFCLNRPSTVESAVDSYRENNDWLGHFLSDCCMVGANCHTKSGELYSTYRAYASSAGEYVRSTTDFYSAMEFRGFTRHRTKKGVIVDGLMLLEAREFLE